MHSLATKCTKIYNVRKAIVRLIKPFVLRRFRCRCGLYKVPTVVVCKKVTMSTYQCSVCFYICDLSLEVIEKFQANKSAAYHRTQRIGGYF